MTETSDVSSGCYGVRTQNIVVGVFLKFLSLVGDSFSVCDDSNASISIKACVLNLGLEGEALDLCKVNILHLEKIRDLLESVFKRDFGVFGDVSELSNQ